MQLHQSKEQTSSGKDGSCIIGTLAIPSRYQEDRAAPDCQRLGLFDVIIVLCSFERNSVQAPKTGLIRFDMLRLRHTQKICYTVKCYKALTRAIKSNGFAPSKKRPNMRIGQVS